MTLRAGRQAVASGRRRFRPSGWVGYNCQPGGRYYTASATPNLYDVHFGQYGKIGCNRLYYSPNLPATFDATVSPQKSAWVSCKSSQSAIRTGTLDASIRGYLESIPTNWKVGLTYWHEPNDDFLGKNGTPPFTATQFKECYQRLRTIIDSATLQSGVQVLLAPNFMGYQVASGTTANWDDAWMPTPADGADLMTWDIYGNPGVGTTGTAYDSTYPSASFRINPCLAATSRAGHTRWGILEVNTPKRNWDTDETARTQWLTDFHAYCMNTARTATGPKTAAEVFLLWEAETGVNWDQGFKNAKTKAWWQSVLDAAYGA